VPLLEVEVPLPDQSHSRLAGVIQFIIEGNSVAEEYEQLDHTLAWEAWVAFAVGAALLTATLGWTFRRLAQRTADLQRANQELTMAAKTSALGAVTAHLIHQLKNPLFGLQQFVESQGSLVDMESERQDATAAARRMQAMVNTVIGVLRDEKSGAQYELSLDELAGTIKTRTHDAAAAKGVRLTVACVGEATLPARSVNLMILILVNLIENAIQATPSGGTVRFAATASASGVECEVCDEGPGLPAELAESLFSPHPSAKPGGTGIGLAISKQLANHLGASLDLKGTSAAGCVFRLRLPRQ
jgi:signal transduction histidine kinase